MFSIWTTNSNCCVCCCIDAATFLIQPTNSPRIGARSLVFIQVPAAATSGFITFAPDSLLVIRYNHTQLCSAWSYITGH